MLHARGLSRVLWTALFVAGVGLSAAAADTYPNCNWRCTANDVAAVRIYVDAANSCSSGQTITAGVYITFNNGTNSSRYAVRLLADLYVDGQVTRSFNECVASTMSPGVSDIRLATISFPCGAQIEFRNIILSWSASPESCSDTPRCSSRAAKCWSGGTVPVSGLPLLATASATTPVCNEVAVRFSGGASGGSLSYTYRWTFGDGATSSQANPEHTYAGPGTYTATLTVSDGEGRTAQASTTVVVQARPTATATNGGPYCVGETIALAASGGSTYAWTGPNGFASTLQNPQIAGATAGNEGTYIVTVTSSAGCTATASTAVAVNAAPHATDRTVRVTEDEVASLALTATDADGDPLTYGVVSGPSHGTITGFDAATGELVYTPSANYNGPDSLVFEACDPHEEHGCAQATVSITVTPTADPPVASDSQTSTPEDTPVAVRIQGTDADGDALTYAILTPPSHGRITGFDAATGELVYTPDANRSGPDSFVFEVCDPSGACDTGVVRIEVTPRNDPPVANDKSVTVTEEAAAALTVTATDADGDALTYAILTPPSHGTITGFDAATGSLVYTSYADYNGPDSFVFEACDPSGACDTGTVSITVTGVDDPPVADPQAVVTAEDTAKAIVVTGSDADGDPLTYGVVSGPSHGTITGFDAATGELVYTPDTDYTGPDSFVFEVCDPHEGHGCAQATVTITVTPVNDPPEARDQSRVTAEDTATGFFALAITDPDHTLSEVECDCLVPPQHGTVERGPNHTVNYTPEADFAGQDQFSYIVCDPVGACDTATVTVLVTSENDNPSVTAGSVETWENTAVDVTVTHADPDGDVLTCVLSEPGHGVVDPSGGTVSGPYPATGTVTYTPAAGFVGTDQFTVTCDDGKGGTDVATVEVTVLAVNDRPTANDGAITLAEDTSTGVTLTATDPDGDTLTFAVLTVPSHGTITGFNAATGTLVYTPYEDYGGPDAFTFSACDPSGACDTGTISITVTGVDDPPVADPQAVVTVEDTAKAIVVTGSDADGDPLTYGVASGPSHGTITGFDAATGSLTYTPSANYNGPDSLVFEACDPHEEHGCAQATVSITVTPVNDPPTATDQFRTTDEDKATGFFALAISDPDDALNVLACDCLVPPQHGMVERGPNHTVNYTPDADFFGVDQFTYVVCDGDGLCDTALVTVSVAPVNDPPAGTGGPFVTPEDKPVRIAVAATDAEGEELVFTQIGGPQHGTIESFDPATGSATFIPDTGFSGSDSFRVEVCDASGGCSIITLRVLVVEANDAPVAACYSTTITQGAASPVSVLATDPDGDPLTYSIQEHPTHGRIESFDPATGTLVYVSDNAYTGPDEISFLVCDDRGLCDECIIQLFVVRNAGGGGAVGACEQDVVISEIAWAGTRADETHEWIELRNLADEPVDLTGWTLRWRATAPTSDEAGMWRVIALQGSVDAAQRDVPIEWSADENVPGAAWMLRDEQQRGDAFLLERGTDDAVILVRADQVYDDRLALGRTAELPDDGALVQLIDPTGCLVDTVNSTNVDVAAWYAGGGVASASMERTDLHDIDRSWNWHTNLGLVRNGLDAWGNLIWGTPKQGNSPAPVGLVATLAVDPVGIIQGDALAVPLTAQVTWPADPVLWRVLALTAAGTVAKASWTVEATLSEVVVTVETGLLPIGPVSIWVRTPTGDVLAVALTVSR